jgi:hypothetical protein
MAFVPQHHPERVVNRARVPVRRPYARTRTAEVIMSLRLSTGMNQVVPERCAQVEPRAVQAEHSRADRRYR